MLKWNGKPVIDKTLLAAAKGIDSVMAKCIVMAKVDVPVVTATLQGSIRMEPAQIQGDVLVGKWGSYNVMYAVFVELGTIHMDAQPYLRPAADKYYPTLPGEIRRAMA